MGIIQFFKNNKTSSAVFLGGLGGREVLSLIGQTVAAWATALTLVMAAVMIYLHGRIKTRSFIFTTIGCVIAIAGIVVVISLRQNTSTVQPSISITAPAINNGVNNGIIIGNNLAPFTIQQTTTDRKLNPDSERQLLGFLNRAPFKSIDILSISGDGEAYRLALQIQNFLTSENLTAGIGYVYGWLPTSRCGG